MEVEASLRLFGGKRKLVERVKDECGDLGVGQLSWAPTSLAAVATARSGASNGFAKPLGQLLDSLPLETLTVLDRIAGHRAEGPIGEHDRVVGLARVGHHHRSTVRLDGREEQVRGLVDHTAGLGDDPRSRAPQGRCQGEVEGRGVFA